MSAPEDPRRLNDKFDLTSIEAHVKGYAETLSHVLQMLDWAQLDAAVHEIEAARARGGRLWVAGNGGSASIADHLLCDWVKGTYIAGKAPIHVHSLVANTALLTACTNDFGHEVGFARQIEMQAQPGDLVICISSSGNSPNILAALRKAKEMGLKTIAVTGFGGGESVKIADIRLHVPAHNYGVVEDCHQLLMHNIAQFIYGRAARGA